MAHCPIFLGVLRILDGSGLRSSMNLWSVVWVPWVWEITVPGRRKRAHAVYDLGVRSTVQVWSPFGLATGRIISGIHVRMALPDTWYFLVGWYRLHAIEKWGEHFVNRCRSGDERRISRVSSKLEMPPWQGHVRRWKWAPKGYSIP